MNSQTVSDEGSVSDDRAAELAERAEVLLARAAELAETGDLAGALVATDEAVSTYHELVSAERSELRPQLVAALDRLAQLRELTGSDDALDAIDAAVEGFTELAAESPEAYLPALAATLNNQASMHEAAGRHDTARAALEKAVDLHRDLAGFDPVRFSGDLALVTYNLVTMLQPGEAPADIWTASIESMPLPQGRARVRSAQAAWFADAGEPAAAAQALVAAAADADTPDPQVPAGAVAAARQQVRSVAAQLTPPPTELPAWAVAALPDDHLALVNEWGQADGGEGLEAVLRRHQELLGSAELSATLEVLRALHPTAAHLQFLAEVLALVAARGLEPTVAELAASHHRQQTVVGWISAPSAAAVMEFLAEHEQVLTDPSVVQLFESMHDPTVRPHLAILHLHQRFGLDRVTRIVTDPQAALEHGLAAVDAADAMLLAQLVTANQPAAEVPGTGPFLLAVLMLGLGQHEEALGFARTAVQGSTAEQRAERLANLRRLAAALEAAAVPRPDGPSTLDSIVELFVAEG